jgi:hypothetical protein
MDIVERLAQQAAETINGGEFYDGKWYTEGQRQAWRKAMTPAADEIERLREDKAELVEALIDMRNHINKRDWDENVSNEAKATFAKATGDE